MTTELLTSFWGHLEEFRGTLIKVCLTLAIGFFIALFFHQMLFQTLFTPTSSSNDLLLESVTTKRVSNLSNHPLPFKLPEKTQILEKYLVEGTVIKPQGYIEYNQVSNETQLVVLSPLAGFMTVFKLSFVVGSLLTSPFWLYFLVLFVQPALKTEEKKVVFPFILLSYIAILLGFLFAHWVTLPFANQTLSAFNEALGENRWSLVEYIDFTLMLYGCHALAFEAVFLLFFLVRHDFLTAQWLVQKRRYMIVFAFILGALFTPPDVLSQLMLAIPLVIFYEIAIFYAKWREKKCHLLGMNVN